MYMTCSHQHNCFITAQDNWHESCPMCLWIFTYLHLQSKRDHYQCLGRRDSKWKKTYCFIIGPIGRHEVMELALAISAIFLIWGKIQTSIELCIHEYVPHNLQWIMAVYFIFLLHPYWWFFCYSTFILAWEWLLRNVSNLDCINMGL